MDIRSRPHDPEVDQLARQIFAMFPKCMRCGQPIAAFEDAEVRILSHRVVHREACGEEARPEKAGGVVIPGEARDLHEE